MLSFVHSTPTLGILGVVGGVVSMIIPPLIPEVAVLSELSDAITRKYHVPSAKVEGAKLVLFVVELPLTLENVGLADHSSVYAGFLRPTPASLAAVQLTVGVLSVVGVVALGVPGVVGAVVSLVVISIFAAATEGILPDEPYSTTYPGNVVPLHGRSFHLPLPPAKN